MLTWLTLAPLLVPVPAPVLGPQGQAVEVEHPRGSVVDVDTGAPVVGHPVRLRDGGGEPVLVLTDAEGRFEIERPSGDRGYVLPVADPTPEWRAVRTLDRGDPSDPIVLKVRRTETRLLRGRAVDRQGVALPYFVLRLFEPYGPEEVVVTDEFGQFVSEVPFAATRMHASSRENGLAGSGDWFENDWSDVELEFDVGERVDLDVRLPVGKPAEEFMAFPAKPGEHPAPMGGHGTVLREGVRPWLRCSANGWPRYERSRHDLVLRSDDGFWTARIRGPIKPDAVPRVDFEPSGVLRLTLRAPGVMHQPSFGGGSSPRWKVETIAVKLTRIGPGGKLEQSLEGRAYPALEVEFPGLEPGRWRVETTAGHFPSTSAEALVSAGRSVPLEVMLGAPVECDELVVRLVDSAGDFPKYESAWRGPNYSARVRRPGASYSIVTFASCGNGLDGWFQRVERDGRFVMEATLSELPIADYEIELDVDGRSFEGPSVARPGEPAVFELKQTVFGMRVTDARSGAPVGRYRVRELGEDPPGNLTELPDPEGVHARGVATDDLGHWCVVAPGYQRAYGTGHGHTSGPDGVWADVELQRGWGVRVEARTPDDKRATGTLGQFAGRTVEFERGGDRAARRSARARGPAHRARGLGGRGRRPRRGGPLRSRARRAARDAAAALVAGAQRRPGGLVDRHAYRHGAVIASRQRQGPSLEHADPIADQDVLDREGEARDSGISGAALDGASRRCRCPRPLPRRPARSPCRS